MRRPVVEFNDCNDGLYASFYASLSHVSQQIERKMAYALRQRVVIMWSSYSAMVRANLWCEFATHPTFFALRTV